MLYVIICAILITAAVALSFVSGGYATAIAFLGLCVAGLMPGVEFGASTYIFWGVAMVIVLGLEFILPRTVTRSRLGLPYICVGSLAGVFAGLALSSHAALIIGAVAGAALGGIAYGRTPAGRALEFPSPKFINYLCAKGLPIAVAMSMVGLSAMLLITLYV